MPIVMNMRWDGVTPEQYEAAREQVGWEQHAPEGGLIHIASFDGRRAPGHRRVGDARRTSTGSPRGASCPSCRSSASRASPTSRFTPMHAIWNPGVERTAATAV